MVSQNSLHKILVDELKREGYFHTPQIEAAFRAVPRHLFLPGIALNKVYQDRPIPIKRLGHKFVSTSSQPAMMAIMLEQLDLRPGQRVLEIGAGSGYNAALLAHVVGDTGQVVTVDLDEDIVIKARHHLNTAGFDSVEVVCADGGFGYRAGAPYDRIILTVGAGDIAPAWREQLKPEGRLLLPLLIKGPQLSVAFAQADDHLVSLSLEPCGFVPLRGVFAGSPESLKVGSTLLMDLARLALRLERLGLSKPIHWLEGRFGPDEALVYRLWQRLVTWEAAGRSSPAPFRIRAYPQDCDNVPAAAETVVVKQWTRFVLEWQ